MTPVRKATIEVEQLPNGYWRARVVMVSPRLPEPHDEEATSFHDAGEALDWARGLIEGVTRGLR